MKEAGPEVPVLTLTVDQDAGVELIGQIGIHAPPTGEEWINDLIDFVSPISFPIGNPINWHLSFTNLLDTDGSGVRSPRSKTPTTGCSTTPSGPRS